MRRFKSMVFVRAIFFIPAALAIGFHSARAATLSVPAEFATIQQAIVAAQPGDVVRVAPATYIEGLDFLGKAIVVESVAGPEQTAIHARAGDTGASFTHGETREAVLRGFTVIGPGITISSSSPTIRGNIFYDNVGGPFSYFGAAIGGNFASPLIEQNLFESSQSFRAVPGNPLIAFVNGSNPVVRNNVFSHAPGAAISTSEPPDQTPQFINNTIVNGNIGIFVDGRSPTANQQFVNNIISGNRIGLQLVYGDDSSAPAFHNNLVSGNQANYEGLSDRTGIDGNLAGNPAFADAGGGDYRLTAASAAIDNGNQSAAMLPTSDYPGLARPYDGNGDGSALFDIGAYEFQPGEPPPPGLPVSGGLPTTLNFTASGDPRVLVGSYVLLNWSAGPGVEHCTASGDWSGTYPASATELVRTFHEGDNVYLLSCYTASTSIVGRVTITARVEPLTLDVFVNRSTVPVGDTVWLNWQSSGSNLCIASGDWSGYQFTNGGAYVRVPRVGSNNYTLTCSTPLDSISRTVVVTGVLPKLGFAVAAERTPVGDLHGESMTNITVTLDQPIDRNLFIPFRVAGSEPSTRYQLYISQGASQLLIPGGSTTVSINVRLTYPAYLQCDKTIVLTLGEASEPVQTVIATNTLTVHNYSLSGLACPR